MSDPVEKAERAYARSIPATPHPDEGWIASGLGVAVWSEHTFTDTGLSTRHSVEFNAALEGTGEGSIRVDQIEDLIAILRDIQAAYGDGAR